MKNSMNIYHINPPHSRFAFLLLLAVPLFLGWVYCEHRDIALLAILRLDPEHRAMLDKMWSDARRGHESRLTDSPADTAQGEKPERIDFAAWTAIAGDHSCSPANMLHNVLETTWILEVADVTARLKNNLEKAKGVPYKRVNVLRDSDLQLQAADPEYATRAGSNNVHFLLARPAGLTNATGYGLSTLKTGSELNAAGTYTYFHVNALRKASLLADKNLAPEVRSAISLASLADEAFALHFLEDCFAAGHVAGTWGNASMRKGTHDYYNEHGLEVRTWKGENHVLIGDAWMRPEDAERAAAIVRKSIEQVLDAASGKLRLATPDGTQFSAALPDSFSVCKESFQPSAELDSASRTLITEVLINIPMPGLSSGLGDLPRFRAELGPFIGVVPDIRGYSLSGGFGSSQTKAGGSGGLGVAVRVGVGIEGVMNESGDGLVFVDFGFRQDGASTSQITSSASLEQFGSITAAIPGRGSFIGRFRMPFWLLPGDLILALPFLFPTTPTTYAGMAVQAANGGLIPWQTGIATPIGRFQFILGREIGISMYGYGTTDDRIVIPTGTNNEDATLIGIRSIALDFPVVEYRPFRTFSMDQSSSLVVQLNTGLDIPSSVRVVQPTGAPEPDLKPVWYIGVRMAFDWRYYF